MACGVDRVVQELMDGTYQFDKTPWQMRDLRFVRFTHDGRVIPLCPAALQGISHFLLQAAVKAEQGNLQDVIVSLQTAAQSGVLAPSALGFIQEHIFLATLAQETNQLHMAANYDNRIVFVFQRVRFVGSFETQLGEARHYSAAGSSVLFLPRKPNEPFVDGVIVNYLDRRIFALQVIPLSFLSYFVNHGRIAGDNGSSARPPGKFALFYRRPMEEAHPQR